MEKKVSSECYWNNLDSIYIITKIEFPMSKFIWKVSSVGKANDGNWLLKSEFMTKKKFQEYQKEREYIFSPYRLVPNWIFRRAFSSIYLEMELEFKLLGHQDQVDVLQNLFTISEKEERILLSNNILNNSQD